MTRINFPQADPAGLDRVIKFYDKKIKECMAVRENYLAMMVTKNIMTSEESFSEWAKNLKIYESTLNVETVNDIYSGRLDP